MTVGTVWSFDTFTGYEGMMPLADDLGGLCFITSVDGWDSAPAPRVDSQDRPSTDGTNDGPSTQPGKTITLNGVYRAPDVARMQQGASRLAGALMAGTRYGTLTANEVWLTRKMRVRRGAETLITPLHRSAFKECSFSFVLYGPDGYRIADPITVTTGLPSSTGGLTVPLTVPLAINSTVVSGQASAVNPGTMTGPVTMRINGPVTGPRVSHVGTGQELVFASSLVIPAGQWIDVDMQRHEVLANGQASRAQYVTSRGWSGFEPGVNTWSFSAVSGSGQLIVSATPAWQ